MSEFYVIFDFALDKDALTKDRFSRFLLQTPFLNPVAANPKTETELRSKLGLFQVSME